MTKTIAILLLLLCMGADSCETTAREGAAKVAAEFGAADSTKCHTTDAGCGESSHYECSVHGAWGVAFVRCSGSGTDCALTGLTLAPDLVAP